MDCEAENRFRPEIKREKQGKPREHGVMSAHLAAAIGTFAMLSFARSREQSFFITFLAGACAGFRAILRARTMLVPPPRMPKVICPKLMEQKLCQLAQN
jgi:hypothetical protein